MNRTATTLALALAGWTAAAGLTLAQMEHGAGHGEHAGGAASTDAFREANAEMHAAMDIPYSGDPDVDFARSMIPHHEGAIAMARIQMEHGEDPELRKVAGEIIAAQESEIALLRERLAASGR